MLYTGTPHIFGLPTTAIACVLVKQQTPKKRSNWRLYNRVRDPTGFMMSTCAKLLEWCWYSGFRSTQVPHTYSVSQLLPSHLYLPRNRHRKSAQKLVYTHGVDISLLLCCQRVPNCFNDESTLDCALHRYPTHIRSPNYCHRMFICQGVGSEQSLKLSFIHTNSTFHFCNSVNVGSSASMMDVAVYYCHTGRAGHARTVGMPKSWIVTRLICTSLNCNTVYMYPNLDLQDGVCILKCWMSTGHTYGKFIYTRSFNCNVVYVPKTGIMVLNMYMQNFNLCTVYAYWNLEF